MPSIPDSYIREGIQLGEARGAARGAARGLEIKSLEIAAKMLYKGFDVATIAEFTRLEIETIAHLKRSAKK